MKNTIKSQSGTLLICTLSLIVFLSGCARNEGSYTTVDPTRSTQELTTPLALMDKRVQNSIKAAGPFEKVRKGDGRLRVNANIMNRDNRRIQVQVQCVFKDENGYSINDETPWQNVILTENSVKGLTFNSLSDKAVNFTIRVRQAR